MPKNFGRCVYHGSKPAYSFPMLIIWRMANSFIYGHMLYWVEETHYIASYGQNKKLFMLKTPTFSVPLASKPAHSFPILIKWYKSKCIWVTHPAVYILDSLVHESLYIASFGQNIIVYNGNTYIKCSSWQQTCIVITYDMLIK
jgi:hypothetical protein